MTNLNDKLAGTVLDFTHNHGTDRRIYSPALGERRDLYVYFPPGYHPERSYPAMILMHGIAQDEQFFLRVVGKFDSAMACGALPPFIIAAPDGSIQGRPAALKAASFYLNTNAGRFEDYIVCDIWGFVRITFPFARNANSIFSAAVLQEGSGRIISDSSIATNSKCSQVSCRRSTSVIKTVMENISPVSIPLARLFASVCGRGSPWPSFTG